jgi:hypothetical protein
MRTLALAHKKIALERLTDLCGEAGCRDASRVAHTLGLIIDGALVTRDAAVADTAGRACAAILSDGRL